jgi:hypothetical protein
MPKRIQHIVSTLLVVCYLFVGAAAHLDAFNHLLGFGEGPQKVAQTKPIHPVPGKVYWTQYKHISSLIKIAPVSPAVVQTDEFPRSQQYSLLSLVFNVLICPSTDVSPFSSRAPPADSTIS